MPKRLEIDPAFTALLDQQDEVVHRLQAVAAGFTAKAIEHRLAGPWQGLLPKVYLTHRGEPSRRQRLIAAQLYCGPNSAIDAADACHWHGIKATALDDTLIHVAQPRSDPARSTGFVVVRRTLAPIRVAKSDRLRYVDAATAAIAATRLLHNRRTVLAVLSDALQRKITTYDELLVAHIQGPRANAKLADEALGYLAAGARSAPEADFLRLVAASTILPTPICNAILRLPDGRLISPDALFIDAGVVHETNGRSAHRREDLFDDMQERASAMTDAALAAFHSSPRQLATQGRAILARVERTYVRRRGMGLPPGVELVRLAS